MPTPLNTARWKPLLQRGWAIGIGLWRGGGDHTPYWEDIGRTKGREDVLLDSEEVVRELQKKLSLSPDSTLLYGRSAGGLWAGGLMAKFPDLTLALGSYMEVPYLDVIHTTLNRELPLTNIETDEFGLPEQRISDLRSMIKWSPIDLLKQTRKEKSSFQLLRTSEHDSEVFPYESAKWVSLWNQKNSKRKAWLALDKNQGHFVSGSSALFQQATDISILLFLFRKNRSNRYKMANRKTMNRRNRKNTRKASRKNRKNTRKNRK
jgi:protease II